MFFKIGPDAKRLQVLGLACCAALLAGGLAGCATGQFSTNGPPPSSGPAPLPSNPPSLPPLQAASSVNDYVGTQIPGPFSPTPENLVLHHVDHAATTYAYQNIAFPGAAPNPVPNSSGLTAPWFDFLDLGDSSGVTGLPGIQHYGVTLEETSRFAFFEFSSSTQIAALVPKQTSGCITPTAPATYEFVTLFGAAFNPATDAAYGTLQLSATGKAFQFGGARQYTEAGSVATAGLFPFAPSTCTNASSGAIAQLGYFIDTPPNSANGNIEIRSLLGPTGILVANQQGADASGNPLPLPGVLGMIQLSKPVDLAQVTASANLYNAVEYQPLGPIAVQYGYFDALGGSHTDVVGTGDDVRKLLGSNGLDGGWQTPQMPLSSQAQYNTAFFFGPQDAANPGVFPKASFLYVYTNGNFDPSCPAGTQTYSSPGKGATYIYCSSPAVAMIGQHADKYVILVTGIDVLANNSPAVIVLVQN